jgi:hypothetical protein
LATFLFALWLNLRIWLMMSAAGMCMLTSKGALLQRVHKDITLAVRWYLTYTYQHQNNQPDRVGFDSCCVGSGCALSFAALAAVGPRRVTIHKTF